MPLRVVWLAIFFEGGLVVLAWGLGWLVEQPPFGRVYFSWRAIFWGVVATAPLLLGAWWCTQLSWAPFVRLMREVEERLIPPFSSCPVWELALISLLAGLGEEALFRGVVQSALADGLTPWGSLLFASALFGVGHLITPTYALLAALIGIYLGALFMASANLLVVIIVHALYDFVALIYLIARHKGQDRFFPAGL